jgi:hypothetical protein
MPFKLNFGPSTEFSLPSHRSLQVQGRDASAFLQAQCMNDVNALLPGHWHYSGWLNPQGRVMALFYVLKIDNERLFLVIPELDAQAVMQALQRFVFRMKVAITLETDWHVNGSWQQPGAPDKSGLSVEADTRIAWRPWFSEGRRELCLSRTPAAYDPALEALWHSWDMAAGWPWLTADLCGQWTPQMLSLQRLEAYSLKKGCYPGQEIVARTHYLGKSKRALYWISGQGLAPLQAIQHAGQDIGKLVNASPDGRHGIAVLGGDFDESVTLSRGPDPVSVGTLKM